jgi:streptogrisin C
LTTFSNVIIMSGRAKTRRFLLAAAALLIAANCLAVPAAAHGAPIRLSIRPALRAAEVAGALDYLSRTYGVGAGEAMRRLELQRTAAGLQEVLARDFPDTYAGSWIDQRHGGVLMIASTRPAVLDAPLSAIADRAHIQVVPARRSRRELESIAAGITARLHLPVAQAPVIDDEHNQVVLYNDAALRDDLSAGPAGLAVVRPDDGRLTKSCTLQNCPPPMRGGLKLYIFSSLASRPNWIWYCTNGFNVHGTDGRQYTVTAGHCFEGEGNYADDDSHWVGYYQSSTLAGFFDDYPADGMIAPYLVTGGVNYSRYWLDNQPTNRVWDSRRGAPVPVTGSESYAQIGTGWVLCSTGAGSLDTRCGAVTGKDGGVVTDICTKGGDSGGPLFSEIDNRAYGVLSWGDNADDSCPPGVRSGFSPLSVLFATVEAKSGIGFAVNTD